METFFNWIIGKALRKKTAINSLSTLSYLMVDYFFDFFLYYVAIRFFGPIIGGGSVMIVGITIDLIMLRIYDKKGKDLFGLEELKRLRDYHGDNSYRKFISHVMKKGNLLALFVVAFYSNPCLATIYMRPAGHKKRRMNFKDWLVFLFSASIEIIWIIIVYSVVLVEKYVTENVFF